MTRYIIEKVEINTHILDDKKYQAIFSVEGSKINKSIICIPLRCLQKHWSRHRKGRFSPRHKHFSRMKEALKLMQRRN